MNFAVLAPPIGCLYEGKILNPVGGVNGASEHEDDLPYRLHIASKGHNLGLLVLDVDEVFELLSLIAQLALPVDDLFLGAVADEGVGADPSGDVGVVVDADDEGGEEKDY